MLYTICSGCKRSVLIDSKTDQDKKTKKWWKITYCPKCNYNFDLQEADEPPKSDKSWFKPD